MAMWTQVSLGRERLLLACLRSKATTILADFPVPLIGSYSLPDQISQKTTTYPAKGGLYTPSFSK
jgi:hypothetical protein